MTILDSSAIVLHYAPDNASLIVRCLLEELGLPYEAVLVDRSVKSQESEAYRKLNPDGLIPVCIINGKPVFETAAILLSIADARQSYVVTVENSERPQFLKWLFFLSNSLHTDVRQRFYPEKYVGQYVDNSQDALKQFSSLTLQRVLKRLAIYDNAYDQCGSSYLFGSEPTIVDLYLAVVFRWLQLYPTDTAGEFSTQPFANIVRMAEHLEQRPLIRQACAKEGIAGQCFSRAEPCVPPEGVAL